MLPKNFFLLLKNAALSWLDDKAPRLGAAIAFYSILSIGPLLLLVLAGASHVFGQEAAQGRIVAQMAELIGRDGAKAVENMLIASSNDESGSILATLFGIVMLLVGASGVFGELQDSMNTIWKTKPKPGNGIINLIKNRFLSFSMVLGTGFLLLVSLVISAVISGMGEFTGGILPDLEIALQGLNFLIGFGVVTILFALIFKFLPDTPIAWRDVWIGAALTSALFSIGKFAIGFYLGHSGIASSYGAAGSIVVLLVWVYYSAQILLFGAEFTRVYAEHSGSRMQGIPQ